MADEETNTSPNASIIQQTIKAFQGLSVIQKSMVISISAIMVIFLAGVAIWASQEPMGLLMHDLNPTDTNMVVETLKKLNVKYEIGNDGQSIYVPSKQVTSLRIQILAEGNMTGENVGWEGLDTPGLTSTDFSQRNKFWRTKEKQLAKDLREGLKSLISEARIEITPANDSVFVSDKEPSKAAVILNLKSRKMPAEETIQGIMNYIAAAVDGLKPEGVVIMDQYNRFLSGKKMPPTDLTEAQKNLQREEEELLATKVVQLLEPAVGKGKVRAKATVELDFDKTNIKETIVDPKSQIEVSVDQAAKKSVTREEPLGVPGTPTNIAPADPGLEDQNRLVYTDETRSLTNYEMSVKNLGVEKSLGSTKRVSLSVLIDYRTTHERNEKGQWEALYVAWTPEELEKYRSQAAAAAGIDINRGDTISVESFNFAPTTNPIEEEAARREYWINLGKFIAPFVLIFLSAVVWFVYKLVTRKKDLPAEEAVLLHVEEEEEEEEILPEPKIIPPTKTLEELKAEIEQEINAESASQAPESQRREVIKQRIVEIIAADPENAASLVRSWLVDDEGK